MILTHCAACAAPLGLALGKKCGRCSTRYCGPACQEQHWKEGGHDQLCKLIKKAGGAEQYNANTKYTEAVSVAAEACAEDTKGQTCYICTQALHWKTKEGLVRMCACRGTAGFAHVSCLAEQAKILVDDAEERNLDYEIRDSRWARWTACGLCEQEYHGVVLCALGWACWKTYVSRPEDSNTIRTCAIGVLAHGLGDAGRHEERLQIQQTQFSTQMRLGLSEQELLATRCNIAVCLEELGRDEEALALRRECYATSKRLNVANPGDLYRRVLNLSKSLLDTHRHTEARSFLREQLPRHDARSVQQMTHFSSFAGITPFSLCDTGASEKMCSRLRLFLRSYPRRRSGSTGPRIP
ncbi:unnamed protein product [Pelagomonas calceolata]|uniref:MYND-type domain-containing protein n=1 Tax=Pelagomonas calceolata TaxID=35677 RepID=A0A8J2SSY7_9STRA|nr:unnamed protein product [Pelagomonas calceolata]